MRRPWVLLLGGTLAVTGCSEDDLSRPPGSTSARPDESVYAVLTDDAWTLQEAIDPPANAPIVALELPPLEWYAEYLRSSASASAMVRLSGHRATFDDTQSALEDVGLIFNDLSLQKWQGAGSAPVDPASPTIILLANGATTLMTLSYELDLDQHAAVANSIDGVDQSTWVAAGGVIQ